MKILEQLSKEELQKIVERIYINHVKDLEFYQEFQYGNAKDNKLLADTFRTRIERIDTDIANALKNKQ